MTSPRQADMKELTAETGVQKDSEAGSRASPSPPGPATPAIWVVGEEEMVGLEKRHGRENSSVKTQRAGCE